MKVGRIIMGFLMLVSFFYKSEAQLIKDINSIEVPDDYRVELKGDKTTKLLFKWTSADLKKPGVLFSYSFLLDTINGDFNNPLAIIGGACCASFFNDTIMEVDLDYLAKEVNAIFKSSYNSTFKQGDSITFEWVIDCSATGPNATYENKETQPRRITFVRGQFDNEYVPINLLAPLDNSSFFVEDNPVVKLKFQWNKAYCPTGCSAPQYRIMFDSLGGDFTKPLYFFDIPQSSFDTIHDLRQDVLAQMMYDDGIPVNTPKTYKWTIEVFGNGEQFLALEPKRISLLRGLMRYENTPFYLNTPADNAVFKLENNTDDSIIFSWNKTRSGFPDAAKYSILFSPEAVDFASPIFKFDAITTDTTFIVRYGELRDSLDKIYGKNWTIQELKWTVEADIIGYKFLSNDTNDLRIARGFFTNIQNKQKSLVKVYPNPATNYLNVLLPKESEVNRIEVCDAMGRMVMNIAINPENKNLYFDIKGLRKGVYYLRLQQNKEAVNPIAFIKQ